MSLPLDLVGGPFDLVLDVGGNVGDFAAATHRAWPAARIVSFEPLPDAAESNELRAAGRWQVIEVAISGSAGTATMLHCLNQHSASTLQPPGLVRAEQFGIADSYQPITVERAPLDNWLHLIERGARTRTLLKIDVEGHEGPVLLGANQVLSFVDAVICEVQQAPVYQDCWTAHELDHELRRHGLCFAGVADVLRAAYGQHGQRPQLVQFDGVWLRY